MRARRYPPIRTPARKPLKQPFVLPPHLDLSCVLALFPQRDDKWFDYSGLNNHGVFTDSGFVADRIFPPSVYFDGTTSYVDCGNDSSLDLSIPNAFSIEIVFSIFALTGSAQWIISKWDSGNSFLFRINASDQLNFLWVDNFQRSITVSSLTLTTSIFYHVFFTFIPGFQNLYVNGLLLNSTSFTGDSNQDTGNIILGIHHPTNDPFKGHINSAFIYTRELSLDEIIRNFSLLRFN